MQQWIDIRKQFGRILFLFSPEILDCQSQTFSRTLHGKQLCGGITNTVIIQEILINGSKTNFCA